MLIGGLWHSGARAPRAYSQPLPPACTLRAPLVCGPLRASYISNPSAVDMRPAHPRSVPRGKPRDTT